MDGQTQARLVAAVAGETFMSKNALKQTNVREVTAHAFILADTCQKSPGFAALTEVDWFSLTAPIVNL
jgi:hypothetical protein